MRQKAEREDALDKEKASERAAKEREIARMRSQQQKSKDIQAALDEMNALRSLEEVMITGILIMVLIIHKIL